MNQSEKAIATFLITIMALALMASMTSCKCTKQSKVYIPKNTYYTNK